MYTYVCVSEYHKYLWKREEDVRSLENGVIGVIGHRTWVLVSELGLQANEVFCDTFPGHI